MPERASDPIPRKAKSEGRAIPASKERCQKGEPKFRKSAMPERASQKKGKREGRGLIGPDVRRRAEGVAPLRRGEGNEAVGVFKRVPD